MSKKFPQSFPDREWLRFDYPSPYPSRQGRGITWDARTLFPFIYKVMADSPISAWLV
jgi:hypothetical protein